jgi:hypothetical protein
MPVSMSIPEKIGQLLALADATTHPDEKKLAYARAMKEASRHSIDLAVARAAVAKGQKRETPTHKRVVIGKKGQVALSWYVDLMQLMADVNDLEYTFFGNVGMTLFGMPSDIEVCEAMYATAVTSMVAGGDEYLRKGEYKKDVQPRSVKIKKPNPKYDPDRPWQREWHYDANYRDVYRLVPKFVYEWTVVEKPVSGMTARQNFYKGFIQQMSQTLRSTKREVEYAAKQAAAELEQVANVESSSTALILYAKRDEVRSHKNDFYKGVKLGTYRGGSKSPVHSAGAVAAGGAHAKATNMGTSRTGIGGAHKQIGGGA